MNEVLSTWKDKFIWDKNEEINTENEEINTENKLLII